MTRGGARVRTPNVRSIQESIELSNESEDSDYDYTYGVCDSIKHKFKGENAEAIVNIGGIDLKVLIDTGSNIDTISKAHYEKLFKHSFPKLEKYHKTAIAYASRVPIPVIGTFKTSVTSNNAETETVFHVVDHTDHSLLS